MSMSSYITAYIKIGLVVDIIVSLFPAGENLDASSNNVLLIIPPKTKVHHSMFSILCDNARIVENDD